MKKMLSVLVLCCLLLCSSCSIMARNREFTCGPFHYTVRSDWYSDSYEVDGFPVNTHMRNENNPSSGQIQVMTYSSQFISTMSAIASIPTVLDSLIGTDYNDFLLSSLIQGTVTGMGGQLESSSRETFEHISGRVFSFFVESENLHYAGFAAYEKETFLVMFYCDERRTPEELMTGLKEELLPTVRVEE